jgi:hypothetical protein
MRNGTKKQRQAAHAAKVRECKERVLKAAEDWATCHAAIQFSDPKACTKLAEQMRAQDALWLAVTALWTERRFGP